jgi:hypothetical protein
MRCPTAWLRLLAAAFAIVLTSGVDQSGELVGTFNAGIVLELQLGRMTQAKLPANLAA